LLSLLDFKIHKRDIILS